MGNTKVILLLLGVSLVPAGPAALQAQGRQVKVVLQFERSGAERGQALGAAGGVIITRRGSPLPSGRLTAEESQTRIQQSTGIFTLVQDGSESLLSVATRIPYDQAAFYWDYAAGKGYITRSVVFQEVGTALKVHAAILPNEQVRVRLTPRISYFSADRSGAIEFTEASTELVVPNGEPVFIGGASSESHEVMRRILGFGQRQGMSETSLTLTATVQ